ncbi:DUF803-domain-containing protein [Patellaria atrata CBS 101060]|uniref:DUF803-domain-containing protein n=1 Tax=Patellaria atrata CBS 101060 TaxID=1346257 RepID=A0A9P4SFV3_9PEZI|nr:DUF803-domain-containing protein [Patellaria atrata CBS 101060]
MFIPVSHDAAETSASPTTILGLFNAAKGGDDYYSGSWSSLIGIITAIVGNILISFALNIQRYAHIRLSREQQEREKSRRVRARSRIRSTRGEARYGTAKTKGTRDKRNGVNSALAVEEEEEEEDVGEETPLMDTCASLDSQTTVRARHHGEDEDTVKTKSYLKSPYWWIGIVLMTTGEAGNFIAYGFAPASIVSPLGVVALISNCIIAPFMLKETFRKRDGLGVLIAVAGAVTVVLSAPDSNPKLGPGDIWNLISRWEFETYFGITVALIAGLMWASKEYGQKLIFIDLGLVGLFGAYTALSTKGVASLLSYKLWRVLTFPVAYLLVVVLVGTAIMQIRYVNRALQRFDSTQVIPTQFVMFTLSVIIGSAILYRDFYKMPAEDAVKFVAGCGLTFSGVWLITSARPPRDDDLEDTAPEPEDAINLAEERYQDDLPTSETVISRRQSTLSHHSKAPQKTPVTLSRTTTRSSTASSPPTTPMPRLPPQISITPNPSTPPSALSNPTPLAENPWHTPTSNMSTPADTFSTPSAFPTLSRAPTEDATLTPAPALLKSTKSAPILPSEQRLQTSHKQLSQNIYNPNDEEQVPIERISTLRARNSIVEGMLPGPFMSPLSGGLSAVVADTLRRVEGGGRRVGRRVFDARRSEGALVGVDNGDGEENERREERGRSKSLSGTLGSWLERFRDSRAGEEGGGET